MLLDPAGGLKGIPENALKIVLFNQSDTVKLSVDDLSRMLKLLDKFDRVLVAALATKPGEVIGDAVAQKVTIGKRAISSIRAGRRGHAMSGLEMKASG